MYFWEGEETLPQPVWDLANADSLDIILSLVNTLGWHSAGLRQNEIHSCGYHSLPITAVLTDLPMQ